MKSKSMDSRRAWGKIPRHKNVKRASPSSLLPTRHGQHVVWTITRGPEPQLPRLVDDQQQDHGAQRFVGRMEATCVRNQAETHSDTGDPQSIHGSYVPRRVVRQTSGASRSPAMADKWTFRGYWPRGSTPCPLGLISHNCTLNHSQSIDLH